MLCFQPVLLAGGMIANRRMKKNHPLALSVYTALVLMVASFMGLGLVNGEIDLSFVWSLSFGSWALFVMAGLFTIFENTTKFLAFRYYQAAPLQKLAFLSNVWVFACDWLFFDKNYSDWQLAGFILLFVFYTWELSNELCKNQELEEAAIIPDPSIYDDEYKTLAEGP